MALPYSISRKYNELKVITHGKLKSLKDIETLRNKMIKSNYPASITDCEVIGIHGDCNMKDCHIFLDGDCEHESEISEGG